MTKLYSTCDLPGGWYQAYTVKDEAEAEKIAKGQLAYLFQSRVITALYLFVPVMEAK